MSDSILYKYSFMTTSFLIMSDLTMMRQFYFAYPIGATLLHQLGWSHYVELLKLDNELERSFYEKQSIRENWSVRELKRQISASLFLRLATSKNKHQVLELAKQGKTIVHPTDIIRDPYILDFLKIPEPHNYTESKLGKNYSVRENNILRHIY